MNDLFAHKGSDGYSAKDIEVLEGLEPVRRRPGMYIGGTDETALHHLAAELLDNAMDEAVAGHASFIEVTLERDNWLTVRDNGRGIPVVSSAVRSMPRPVACTVWAAPWSTRYPPRCRSRSPATVCCGSRAMRG